MMFTFLEKTLNLVIFTHAPVPHPKRQENFSKACFPQDERGGETMICSIKILSENIKMTWNISLFIFCIIINFSNCDGLTFL